MFTEYLTPYNVTLVLIIIILIMAIYPLKKNLKLTKDALSDESLELTEMSAAHSALTATYGMAVNENGSLKVLIETTRENSRLRQSELDIAQTDLRSQCFINEELKTNINELKSEKAQAVFELGDLRVKFAELSTKIELQDSNNNELKINIRELRSEKDNVVSELGELRVRFGELNTKANDEREHFQEQKKQFGETKDVMTQEFENVANRIFDNKGKSFTDSNQQSMDAMLKPFKEQIEGFQKRVNEVHETSVRDTSILSSEIKKVLDVGMKMSDEANNLSTTLKGSSQQRGAWGEAQLERTLEMSGLVEAEHYDKQSSFKNSEGKTRLTDYLIKLPDNKHIVIDSKVTMVAYDKAVNAENDELHMEAMKEHLSAVRKHMDDLASKDYTNLIGIESPSFVLMFMPIEPAYIDALKASKDLFEYGYQKGIILVSHTTLIPILRTVSNLWMVDRSNKEAREVSLRAGEIYNSVCMVAERVQKLGSTLNTANKHYNETVRGLTGNQGLFGKVDRFNTLSTKISKTLPIMEESHLEHETTRLNLAVEAIKEVEKIDKPTSDIGVVEHLPENINDKSVSSEEVASLEKTQVEQVARLESDVFDGFDGIDDLNHTETIKEDLVNKSALIGTEDDLYNEVSRLEAELEAEALAELDR